jgi:Carboxypeptidase regulatory-like domain
MKRHFVRLCVLALTVASLTAGSVAYSQAVNSQQISGTVKDSAGLVVPNATIAVTDTGTGLVKTVKSNSDGNYVVLDLPVGMYSVTATAPGFETFVVQGINVDVAGMPSVPVTLHVGQVTQSVTVNANPVQVETTTAAVGAVITSKEATQIQLNGRNYIQLVQLTPGVSVTAASPFALQVPLPCLAPTASMAVLSPLMEPARTHTTSSLTA